MEAVRKAQQEGKLLTAALYYDKRALYFYYEAMGQDLAVTEPHCGQGRGTVLAGIRRGCAGFSAKALGTSGSFE